MYRKTISKFWNRKKRINNFANEKPSEHLVKFFSKISNLKSKKILDIGCGAGRNTEMLSGFGSDVYACDTHKAMVEFTKKRVAKFGKDKTKKIIIASMSSLPYRDRTFDFVVSNGVFHNACSFEELLIAVRESARVLKKHGKLALNIFSSKVIDSKIKKLKTKKFAYVTSSGLPMILVSKKDLIRILNKNNLYQVGPITETRTILDVGVRCVLKGFFKKK